MKNAFEVKRLIGLLVCIGFMLGMDTSSLSLFLGTSYFKEYFKQPTALQTGMMTGANQIGGFVGCLMSGSLIELIGCKWCLCACSVIWTMGSVGSFFVLEVYTMAPVSYTHLDVYKRQQKSQYVMVQIYFYFTGNAIEKIAKQLGWLGKRVISSA